MRFSVRHFTRYEYSVPVTLGAHVLRLLPQGPAVTVRSHELVIEPIPWIREERSDGHGNRVLYLEFQGDALAFGIESRFEADTTFPPPLSTHGSGQLPWPRPFVAGPPADSRVVAFVDDLVGQVGGSVVGFLELLNRVLFERTDRRIRIEGNAQSPAETLERRVGACRDLTVLFLECCRLVGMSGRFVSGYQATADTPDGQRHLHAWPEVFIPGLGFRGFDPTHGLPVADGHLPLCRAPTQLETMPVEGGYSFQGPTLTSTLTYAVQIGTS